MGTGETDGADEGRGEDRPVVGVTAASEFDLSVEREVFGDRVELRAVDVGSSADIVEKLGDADAVIDRLFAAPYTAAVFDGLSARVVVRCGIGVDGLDTEHAAERGVWVANVPDYCQEEVATHTLAFVLALNRRLTPQNAAMHDGRWERRTEGLHRLSTRTLGLVGFGSIAREVASRARALGLEVVAADPYVDADEMADHGVESTTQADLLSRAHVVSLHAPLVEDTRGLIDADALGRMRDDAVLVNVARGGLIDESALAEALDAGEIAGAGLDVFVDEPADQGGSVPFDHPLRGHDNVVLTPHVAWASAEADLERRRTAAEDVRRVLDGGTPENPVNDPR